MKYLKSFESINYGENHFGTPIFDYFPWYIYPKTIHELPKFKKGFRFYQNAIKVKRITSFWWTEDGILVTGGGFDKENPTFVVYPQDGEMVIDGRTYSVDDWADIEKLRLISLLGKRTDAEKYLKQLDEINEFLEVIEDAEDYSDTGFDYQKDFSVYTSKELYQNGLTLKEKQTDEEIINFIKEYSGKVEFYLSLRKYLEKNGKLTIRQINSIPRSRVLLSDESLGISDNRLVLAIRSEISDLAIQRFKNMGYTIKEVNSIKLIYKE